MSGGELRNRAWLDWPESRAVMSALQGTDSEVVARFVGGAVRDGILGREVQDVDIASVLPPQEVMARLEAQGIKMVPTGLDHGTVTAVVDGRPFEITTLRTDVETDGRHAVVAFTTDWAADAARRDFTMNALYADADGALYDPCGGLGDLEAGYVRFIGDPEARISEDALRILRFFRFHAWYGGKGTAGPDAAGLAACARLAACLKLLSAERVSAEILRLFAAPDPMPAVRLMAQSGVLQAVLPEAVLVDRLEELVALERALGRGDPLRRLAALLPDGAGEVGARLRLSKREQLRLAEMVVPRDDIAPSAEGPAFGRRLRAIFYRIGRETTIDHILLNWAARGGNPRAKRWADLLAAAEVWPRPEFSVYGRDAIALGAKPGPAVGDILSELEIWWESRDFKPTRADLLARLERRLSHSQTRV